MKLHEIASDFDEPKATPQERIERATSKTKGLEHERDLISSMKHAIDDKLTGNSLQAAGWSEKNPQTQQPQIDARIADGWLPWFETQSGYAEPIVMWYYKVENNPALANRLKSLNKKALAIGVAIKENIKEIERAKVALQAWKRKQPDYVSSKLGKDIVKDLANNIVDKLAEMNIAVSLNQSYYWKKNKMIVVELLCATPSDGLSVWNTLKQKVKPQVEKIMQGLGYNQYRFKDQYIDTNHSILKIQIDDVEAKNISTT